MADDKGEEMILKDVVNVLRAGNALKNPEKWKKGHWLVSMVSLLVTSAAGILKWKFPDLVLDDDTLNLIIQIGCFVLAAANGYLIPATTEKPLTKKGAAKVKEKQESPAIKPMVKYINPGHEVK